MNKAQLQVMLKQAPFEKSSLSEGVPADEAAFRDRNAKFTRGVIVNW